MEMVMSNRVVCNHLESSSWNNHKKNWLFGVPGMKFLVIQAVTFLEMVSSRDPFKGCWWPPTFGDKKVTIWITWYWLVHDGLWNIPCVDWVVLIVIPQKKTAFTNHQGPNWSKKLVKNLMQI